MLALLVVILYKKITELRVHKLCCQSKLNKSGLPVFNVGEGIPSEIYNHTL